MRLLRVRQKIVPREVMSAQMCIFLLFISTFISAFFPCNSEFIGFHVFFLQVHIIWTMDTNMHVHTHFVHIRWKLDGHKETSLKGTSQIEWAQGNQHERDFTNLIGGGHVITSGQNNHMCSQRFHQGRHQPQGAYKNVIF